MKLNHPPERYTEVRLESSLCNSWGGPWYVAAYTEDLSERQISALIDNFRTAWQLQQELQATCYAARRLLGLPTPLLNRP
ncbi:MAG: hypothetical protein JSS14_21765 [Proteobacteria bacterium]|nr:hypothetical protein [Pseudomonadota bacterium]